MKNRPIFFATALFFVVLPELILGQNSLFDSLSATITSPELRDAYHTLLEPTDVNEYGWICEYSTVGQPPSQRLAIISLIKNNQIELIESLLSAPHVETQLYALDALIYMKHRSGESLSNDLIYIMKNLRNSSQKVITCGNWGSYNLYEVEISTVMIKNSESKIIENYSVLESLGYFR